MVKVVQTWDDGLVADIELIKILRRHHAKASFCLNPGLHQEGRSLSWVREGREIWRLSRGELYDVYDGFEIWSHSLTHPDLTNLSREQLTREVKASREMLEEIFRRQVLGFAYPFNACNDVVKETVRAAGYRWARGPRPQGDDSPPTGPWCGDPLEFPPSCHFLAPDFWERYDRRRLRAGVFFFWGHSYELVGAEMWREFEARIRGISLDPQAEWCFFSELNL
ncbi:MAG TPA: polysaccharide deacetylase family protein [Syntrophales bacterium]|jgi:peptidoglycan/xylan/chitin deacetylase (PgdA/CDA1 family)|nr:polysaccharide deacetylase family protein [Syntrophales bacterium]